MAQRPVFTPRDTRPYVSIYMPQFVWNAGLSVAQKKRNVTALHQAFRELFPGKRVLEISSKSDEPLGIALSAFNLTKTVAGLEKPAPVECVYQGSKVMRTGGPYPELFSGTARGAKKDPRIREGALVGFRFQGQEFPLTPPTAFYDWLYICALLEHPELVRELVTWDAFTDIEFNPEKGVSCQARTAALFVSLHRAGLTEQCRDFYTFPELLKAK